LWRIYIHKQYEVKELFDADLAQSAQILLRLIQYEIEKQKIVIEQPLFGHQLAFLVRSSDGHIIKV
jgi:hypothetical protein